MTGLDAVREHHLAEARAQAATLIADARTAAASALDKARADATELTRRAERDGQASAEQDGGREWTAARRRARAIVLRAQRGVYDRLMSLCARDVRTDPRYPALQRNIAGAARERLGPGADVVIDGDTVTVTRHARRIRWSLEPALDEALRALGDEVEALYR